MDDWFNNIVEEAYQRFVVAGGLDQPQTTVIDEDWERTQRQHHYCVHNLPTQKCERGCRRVLPGYWP
jgi:hypothetical protein